MITLGQLLEEIKIGKEKAEAKQTLKELENYIDEDYNIFLASERIRDILKEEVELADKKVFPLLNKISNRLSDYENKILSSETPSSVYKRMKAESLEEDITKIYSVLLKDKKLAHRLNTKSIKKALGAAEHSYRSLAEEAKIKIKKFPTMPSHIQNYINEEINLIEQSYD